MKKTKANFSVAQVVDKLMSVEPEQYVLVSILERRWAGHCWYYRIEYSNGATSWVLESQLRAPIGVVV
jgi:hypothetical protein